ncbi:MAG: hypothetical protein IPK22_26200 [Verrucomicrobiaceae bacterium]|nr:hypothetical protein [Verrucomicrobiaceae bacterium]
MRNDTILSDAANVSRFFGPAAADAAAFNARDHSYTDVNFDFTASTRFTPNDWSAYEIAFARKNRAPSLLERYLWTPSSQCRHGRWPQLPRQSRSELRDFLSARLHRRLPR